MITIVRTMRTMMRMMMMMMRMMRMMRMMMIGDRRWVLIHGGDVARHDRRMVKGRRRMLV